MGTIIGDAVKSSYRKIVYKLNYVLKYLSGGTKTSCVLYLVEKDTLRYFRFQDFAKKQNKKSISR